MLNHKKESLPIWGELYPKRQAILKRLEAEGPEAIQKEIAELWIEIQIRTDILSEYKGRE